MFTKDKLKDIHADIRTAMQNIATKHGLVFSPQSKISYTETTFKFTAEFGDEKATAGADPRMLIAMRKHGWKFLLKESDIGGHFTSTSQGKMTILGMNGYSKVVAQTEGGDKYLFPAKDVAKKLGRTSNLDFTNHA